MTIPRRQFLATLAAPLAAQTPTRTTAERLGRGDAKLLMVHADDAGMCHSVNLATKEALLSGAIQSASIMMPCSWVPEIAETARQNPTLDFGLHLTLTSEWKYYRWRPVAPPEKVKGLFDTEGYIWRDEVSTAKHASPAEIEIEILAQIERARQFSIPFTHLDTHMGTLYTRVDYFESYAKLARQARVPCMIPRPTAELMAAERGSPITAEMLLRKETEGHVLLDRLVTNVPGRNFEERRKSYIQFLRDLKPGVTKLIVHLSMDDPEIRAISGAWERRWADFKFWTSSEARTLLRELNIQPITYRELGKLS